MNPHRKATRRVLTLALTLASIGSWGTARADMIYAVTANTSALSGMSGYLDLQFNPNGTPPAITTSATVTMFSTNGTLDTINGPTITGDVTGSLPGTVTFDNGSNPNDYLQGFTFGSTISFDVKLSGPDLNDPLRGDIFAFTLFDGAGNPFSTGPGPGQGGAIVTIEVNPDGSTTGTAYGPLDPKATGPTATVTPLANAVPEPSTWVLTITGLGTILARRRLRRRPAA